LLCLALLSAASARAASSGFLLGIDYSEWILNNESATQIATDASGALYILSPSAVTKMSADGKTILWQNVLGFTANTMAVDPNGGVYVLPVSPPGDTSIYVAKLNANGTGLAWKTTIGLATPNVGWRPVLAVDSQGRAYLAGVFDPMSNQGEIVRLNATGSSIDYALKIAGWPTSIAVDTSGAAFVAGNSYEMGFLTSVTAGGSAGFYSNLPQQSYPIVALDANGNAIVSGSGVLQRFDAAGAAMLSTAVPGGPFAVDVSGNAYVTGNASKLYPVKNTLATCGWNSPSPDAPSDNTNLLTVVAPDGSILQTTYIPSNAVYPSALVATGLNSTVFVVAPAAANFTPTQAGPFPAGQPGTSFLLRLSPNANAQTVSLACMGNAATYDILQIAPGEIVTLFGNGLGPKLGVQTQATLETPFPTHAANVEVTFDGTPAPLLWVQDSQINVVAPWSLAPGQTTKVCASYNRVKTNCLTWPVLQTAPAVFTVDGVFAAALNQDGTVNSADNPAAPGSIVSVFATGLGPIAPSQGDGSLVGLPLPENVLPVEAGEQENLTVGVFGPVINVPLTVTYAGPAPYLVAGTTQINFQVVDAMYGGEIYVSVPSGIEGVPSAASHYFQIHVGIP
jgi:uncharacterized protein (TIGR03437 family)